MFTDVPSAARMQNCLQSAEHQSTSATRQHGSSQKLLGAVRRLWRRGLASTSIHCTLCSTSRSTARCLFPFSCVATNVLLVCFARRQRQLSSLSAHAWQLALPLADIAWLRQGPHAIQTSSASGMCCNCAARVSAKASLQIQRARCYTARLSVLESGDHSQSSGQSSVDDLNTVPNTWCSCRYTDVQAQLDNIQARLGMHCEYARWLGRPAHPHSMGAALA